MNANFISNILGIALFFGGGFLVTIWAIWSTIRDYDSGQEQG